MRDLIKKLLREAVGVPKDIEVASKNLYDDIIKRLSTIDSDNLGDTILFDNSDDRYSFSDYNPEDVTLTINLGEYSTEDNDFEGPIIPGMGISSSGSVNSDFRVIDVNPNEIRMNISFAVPEGFGDIEGSDVSEYLEKNRPEMYSALSHELMHSYDRFKSKGGTKASERAKYSVQNDLRFGIEPLDKFIYGLYFTNFIENIVRPTEIYTHLISQGATEKDFLEKFNNIKSIKELKEFKDYTYEGLIQQLREVPDEIDNFLSRVKGFDDIPDDPEGKVFATLDIVHNIIKGKMKMEFDRIIAPVILQSNPMALFMSMLTGDNSIDITDATHEKMVKDILKFGNNYEQWYKYEIKKMNRVSDTMIRKLSKLFSLVGKKDNNIKIENFDPTSFEMDQLYRKIKKK